MINMENIQLEHSYRVWVVQTQRFVVFSIIKCTLQRVFVRGLMFDSKFIAIKIALSECCVSDLRTISNDQTSHWVECRPRER